MTRKETMSPTLNSIASAQEIIEEAKNGRMFILIDEEERENEGDLIITAEAVTPEVVNFMAKYGRGLICLALERTQVERLGLSLMAQKNASRQQSAFTISIEARQGITTGISAFDRAHTIAVATNPQSGPQDISTPGHVFPLLARDGGVLIRAGHTEATVDIARLAGRKPAGVLCEIMNDDGTMARLPDLIRFATIHNLKIGTIADLIAWRRRTETLVQRLLEVPLNSRFGGEFRLILYINKIAYAEHIVLVKGDLSTPEPVITRMHAISILDDLLHDQRSGGSSTLHAAMTTIAHHGRGIVVLLRESHPMSLSQQLQTETAIPETETAIPAQLRDYGIGAQILLDLGIRDLILLTNSPKTIIGLEGYGLRVIDHWPLTYSLDNIMKD